MGDVPCVCRITGPDEPGRLLRHLGLTDRYTIAKPKRLSSLLADDRDATGLDSALAVPEGRVAVREACTAMRHHGGAGITPRDLRSLWQLPRPQGGWFPEAAGIGAVLEHNRATHIGVTAEFWPGHVAPTDAVDAAERRWPR